ncbi:unnamed protein product [Wickerhamomyces anomalus]
MKSAVAGSIILFESYRQRQKELTRRETVADDIKTLQYEIQYLKRKLQQYNVRLDDYVPPADVKPIVLKLDQNGNEIDLDIAMDKIKAKLKEMEGPKNPELKGVVLEQKNEPTNVSEPRVLKDTKIEAQQKPLEDQK